MALAFQSASSLENARLHAKAVELATTDGLTGLANRRTFQVRIVRRRSTGPSDISILLP